MTESKNENHKKIKVSSGLFAVKMPTIHYMRLQNCFLLERERERERVCVRKTDRQTDKERESIFFIHHISMFMLFSAFAFSPYSALCVCDYECP